MASRAGKFGEFRIDVEKRVAVRIQFLELFAAALSENEMARIAITCRDRLCAISRLVIAIVTTETAIPILVTNVVGMRTPVGLHPGKEILAVYGLRFCNEWIGLRRIRIGRVQRRGDLL